MKISALIWLSPLAALTLSGCGPSQADREREQAQALKEAVGPVDVAPRPSETGTPIPFNDKGEYLLLSANKGKGGHVITVVRRFSDMTGYVYTKRNFDCNSPNFSTIAEADTLDGLGRDKRGPSSGVLFYGSSTHQAAIVACRKFGMELNSVQP